MPVAPYTLPDFDAVVPASAEPGWAATELASLDWLDPRRTARAIDLLQTLSEQPSASLPQACRDAAQLEAAYRFLDNPNIAPQALLAAHTRATWVRLAACPVVLAVSDTTSLDYTSHPHTRDGVGPLRSRKQQGLLVQGTLALTPDGLPVGLLAEEVWHRDPDTYAHLRDRHARTLAEKESGVWLRSLAAATTAHAHVPTAHVVCVGDRAADIFELFSTPRPAGVDVLVRARHDRPLADGGKLRERLAQAPVLADLSLEIPGRSGAPRRTAHLAVRAQAVLFAPPQRAPKGTAALRVWAVWVQERAAPAGVAPLDWLLLTTVPTEDAAAASERVRWYRCRWVIELWHRTLKSGCRLEARQLESGAQLERLLALYSIVAWRLLYAVRLARSEPTLPCTVLLSRLEWEALWIQRHDQPPPPPPPDLRTAVRWIAQLGGFLGRKGDGEPGERALWRGLQRLDDFAAMYARRRHFAAEPL